MYEPICTTIHSEQRSFRCQGPRESDFRASVSSGLIICLSTASLAVATYTLLGPMVLFSISLYLVSLTPALLFFFGLALGIGALAFATEAKRNAAWALLLMVGLMIWVEPRFVYGVLFAYLFAWIGHFLIEHNRPATFQYTLWSLAR